MRSWSDYKKTMQTETTAWQAAKLGDLNALAALIDAGADINARDPRGYSPLMLAVYLGQVEVASYLIEMGADVNSTDFNGNSILMGACFKGHVTMVEMLLMNGANPTARNSTGMTAYDFAITFGRDEVARLVTVDPQSPSQNRRIDAKHNVIKRVIGFAKLLASRFVPA